AAAESGKAVDRANWRVVVPVYLAESRQKAIADIREGYKRQAYRGDRRNPTPQAGAIFAMPAQSADEAAARDGSLIGTPDDAIRGIENILERSGGLGGILMLAHEWAPTEALNRSYELFARY